MITNLPELPRLSDYVFHYAETQPDQEALVLGDQRLTYRQFAAKVTEIGRALIAAGVKPGDRVAMLTTPHPDFFLVFMATAAIGAIWLGLNPRYKLGEFRHVLNEAKPRLLFAAPDLEGRDFRQELTTLKAECGFLEQIITNRGEMAGAIPIAAFLAEAAKTPIADFEARRAAVTPDDAALLIFTSGSTGAPKAAMVKHYGLVHGGLVEQSHWFSSRPVVLVNMPVNHIAGIGMKTGFGLIGGAKIVFQESFQPAECLALVAREGVTFWLQAPTMFHFMVNDPTFANTDLSKVEHIIWAGSAMAYDLVAKLRGIGARLHTAFGMTELSTYATYSDDDASDEVLALTIGKPDARLNLRLADAEGQRVAVGEQGEIQAEGRWVMKGYFNRPAETAASYTPDGWFRTGDTAVERPDGNWMIVGRIKEMYKSGGYNIYPREVEIAIEAHPDVAMAAVIGVSDPIFQEVGHAFVQPEPGRAVDPADLAAWCKERLANYKVPKRFVILEALPRLPIGKIDKVGLRALAKDGGA